MGGKITHLKVAGIISLVLAVNIYSVYNTANIVSQLKTSRLADINKSELASIKSLIDADLDKAEMQAICVKNKAEKDILANYADNKTQLTEDLDKVGNYPVYNILQNNIKGEYLNNVKNDNNDMSVWHVKFGKVSDGSTNCAFKQGEAVTEANEIAKQNNKVVAKQAIDSILGQKNDRYIFWNYLPTPKGFYQIKSMDMSEADKLYDFYGYKGLQYLEFLKPVYCRQFEDIVGVPDVNQNNVKTNNNKLVFVQGFNIVDDLEANHATLIQHFANQRENTIKEYSLVSNTIRILGILTSVILLVSLFMVTAVINDKVEK